MVSTPVDKTLTTGPPVKVPNIAEDTIAARAGQPLKLRVKRKANLISAFPPAQRPNNAPRMIYGKTNNISMFMKRPNNPAF